MDVQKRREITALAEVVRDSLELSVPIDMSEAVNRLGGTIKEVENCDGLQEAMIRRDGERFEITIQRKHSTTRKRFSIAHELGHLFLHMGYLVNPDKWGHSSEYRDSVYHRFGYNIEESEADLFAAAFLMPEKEFRLATKGLRDDQDKFDIKQVANVFKTSPRAILRRGEELGVFRVNFAI